MQGVGRGDDDPRRAVDPHHDVHRGPASATRRSGVWGAVGGLASAAGVFLGGVLTDSSTGAGCSSSTSPPSALVLRGDLPARARRRGGPSAARLRLGRRRCSVTAGMLLLVYTIVEAPESAGAIARTIARLGRRRGAPRGVRGRYEVARRDPAAARSRSCAHGPGGRRRAMVVDRRDSTRCSSSSRSTCRTCSGLEPSSGRLRVPAADLGVAIAAAIAPSADGPGRHAAGDRRGRAARAPAASSGCRGSRSTARYWSNILPALVVTALGLGGGVGRDVHDRRSGRRVAGQGRARRGADQHRRSGSAARSGVAIFSAVATSTTADRLAAQASQAEALTAGFQDALLLAAIFLAAAAVIALRARTSAPGRPRPRPRPTEPRRSR